MFCVIFVSVQLDFWRGLTVAGTPVDVRVPLHGLQSVKIYLETKEIEYSIMIEDLQVGYPFKKNFNFILTTIFLLFYITNMKTIC